MKSNEEAELTVLRYLCQNYSASYLSLIKSEWFYKAEHKAIYRAISDTPHKITYPELSNYIQSKYHGINIDVWLKKDLFSSELVEEGEVGICIDIIEEKYRLRKLEEKLISIHDTMFQSTIASVETDLITYFHANSTNKEPTTSLDENFEEENNDLILFDDKRPALNRLSLLRDTVVTIGGDSSHHKTNQLIDILINALLANYPKNPDFKVMMFSGEMSWRRIRDRIYAKMLHIPLKDITSRNIKVHEVKELFRIGFPQLISNFILIRPDQFRTVNDLSRLVIQYKPDVWGLDFLQYFAQMSAGNNAEQQNKNVMEAIATIKILVEVTHSLGIVLSQLRKKSDQRAVHFPRIDDLEWSGLTKQISDVVGLCFWPYKIRPETATMDWYTVSWQKVRDADPFNEVLSVEPQYCDFKKHPSPNIGKNYFEW